MAVLKTPTWQDFKITKQFPKLEQDLETDVVIAGAGLAGLLTAYNLAKIGKKVVVLEMGRIGEGATSYTTAILTQVIDTDLTDAKNIYGRADTKLIIDSHGKAIDSIEQIIADENIDCEFKRCSNFNYINEESEQDELEDQYHAIKQFMSAVELHKQGDLWFSHKGYIEIKNQAKFHPLKFLNGLVMALEKMGVTIYEQTEVLEIEDDEWVRAKTENNTVTATYSVIATYDPLGNPKQTFMKKGMYITYVYELEIPSGIIPDGVYEDFNNPYHYFRIDKGEKHDRMIIGGEDNRKELEFNEEKNFKALRVYIEKLLRGHEYKTIRKWKGYILEPSDGLALIGEYDHHRLVAAAFSGNGMTYSAITGMLLSDIVNRKDNAWKELYDPKRMPNPKQLFQKFRDYAGTFFGGVVKNTIKY